MLVTESPDGELMVRLVLRSTATEARVRKHLPWLQEELPALRVLTINVQPDHRAVLEGDREVVLTEHDTLPMRLGAITLHLRPRSFFQTNTEVAAALTQCGIAEANVYGVAVPGHDGRAGMAALITSDEIDLPALYACVERALPSYARPLFLRLKPQIETTGTFKHRKVDLVREGFDPAAIDEPLYFNDPHAKTFVPLTPALHRDILSGAVRV